MYLSVRVPSSKKYTMKIREKTARRMGLSKLLSKLMAPPVGKGNPEDGSNELEEREVTTSSPKRGKKVSFADVVRGKIVSTE